MRYLSTKTKLLKYIEDLLKNKGGDLEDTEEIPTLNQLEDKMSLQSRAKPRDAPHADSFEGGGERVANAPRIQTVTMGTALSHDYVFSSRQYLA